MTKSKPLDRISRYTLALLLLGLAPLAAASPVHFWLNKMMESVHQLNYDGHFVYLHGGVIESLRIVHTVEGDNEKERIFSLNGEAREIIRDNHTVTCILPYDKAISTSKRGINKKYFSGLFSLDPSTLAENYQMSIQGRDRIADREVKVIEFQPKDQLRYGYKLFLDDEYALPLQWNMYDQDQQMISSIMFTQINIGDDVQDSGNLLKSDLPPIVKKRPTIAEAAAKPQRQAQWAFIDIPQGFQLKHFITDMPRHKGRDIEHYIFSDGMASFSVYVEKTADTKLQGQARLGALNAFGIYQQGYQITAVGEVPLQTLGFVANIQHKDGITQ
ncbi:MAG: MucB/RseB C-terminal domain-containing protein [Chromatiales bacterium]|jgi:sigma-E factor negative regulatory protein RseB